MTVLAAAARAMRSASELEPVSRLLFLTLAGRAELDGDESPTIDTLAHDTGLARATVIRHLRLLATAGWLAAIRNAGARPRGGGRPATRYALRVQTHTDQPPDRRRASRLH